MSPVLFEGGGFRVTRETLKTSRRTYELKNVEIVTVKQPLLLLFGGVGLGLIIFTVSFFKYLYAPEVIGLVGFSAISIAVSAMFGTLKVHSLAMRSDEGTLYGRIGTLRAVKEAVSEALDARD